jgi:hypothetical protein
MQQNAFSLPFQSSIEVLGLLHGLSVSDMHDIAPQTTFQIDDKRKTTGAGGGDAEA